MTWNTQVLPMTRRKSICTCTGFDCSCTMYHPKRKRLAIHVWPLRLYCEYCCRSQSIHPVDLGKVCQTSKLQLVICNFLGLDEKSKAVDYHDVLC